MTTECKICHTKQVITDPTLNRTFTEADCGQAIVRLQPEEFPSTLGYRFVANSMNVTALGFMAMRVKKVASDKLVIEDKFFLYDRFVPIDREVTNDGKWAILSVVVEYVQKGGKVEEVVCKCFSHSEGVTKNGIKTPEYKQPYPLNNKTGEI